MVVITQQTVHAALGEHAQATVAAVAQIHRLDRRRDELLRAHARAGPLGCVLAPKRGGCLSKSLLHGLPPSRLREVALDIGSRDLCARGRNLRIVADELHQPRRVVHRGFRPGCACSIRPDVFGQLDELERNGKTVADAHEIHVAGPTGGDDGLLGKHGIGDGVAQSLRAVQRHIRVAAAHQITHLVRGPVTAEDRYGMIASHLTHPGEPVWIQVFVDALDHETNVLIATKCLRERFNRG